MRPYLLLILFLVVGKISFSQSAKLQGRVTNNKSEPVAFTSIKVKDSNYGAITKENGTYEIFLEEGKYDLVITMVGYQPKFISIVIRKEDVRQDILLENDDGATLTTVTVRGKFRDKGEEYVTNVIRHKDQVISACGAYSCNAYIKALQEDSVGFKKPKKSKLSDSAWNVRKSNDVFNRMSFAEIALRLDKASLRKVKEERTGINKRGNVNNLFYLTTTSGDFNIYNNLINIPSVSAVPFLSPVSYSGLLAYRYKTTRTDTVNGRRVFTISVRPRQLSNATVEGEIKIIDSLWVILEASFRLPSYHLSEYDFFEVSQEFELINNTAWMITRQELVYQSISDKRKSSGRTMVHFKDFELNKSFPPKYFGSEISSADQQAYERDSLFWSSHRAEPLTPAEVKFINHKDSVYQATHTKAYLDSVDRVTNKITWQNILFKGQDHNDHEKQRRWRFPALPEFYQPFQFGGTRIEAGVSYGKTFKSRKNVNVFLNLSYGLRNNDINGGLDIVKLYNPFKRGYISLKLEKNFEYIYSGDAWINMIKRNNIYLHQSARVGHSIELLNGLYLITDAEMAYRSSVSGYKTNDKVDSLFGSVLDDNSAVDFPSYNAFYGKVQLEYTPRQRFIRDPKEKIILGSRWPTFYVQWRKGIPGIFNSTVDFDYFEFGMRQEVKLGILGTSSYAIKSGAFYNDKDLRLVDYKWQRRGDPFLFMNPNEAFQSLDSTFPVFRRFYEGHYIHEFNGALLNKIPFFKKIGLREIAGAGFLYANERNLTYAELFTGIERVFKYPFNQLGKFKLGVYIIGSAANQFRNPVQFKIGITTWDRRRGRWF